MSSSQLLVPQDYSRLDSVDGCARELQALFAHWLGLKGDRRMPSRQDFDPTQVPRLLRHMILVDVFADAPRERRFRVRLLGTEQVDRLGGDWTGFFPHDGVDLAAAERLCAVGEHIVASREPWISTGKVYWVPGKEHTTFETVLLPLSDDNDNVNMIIGLTKFS